MSIMRSCGGEGMYSFTDAIKFLKEYESIATFMGVMLSIPIGMEVDRRIKNRQNKKNIKTIYKTLISEFRINLKCVMDIDSNYDKNLEKDNLSIPILNLRITMLERCLSVEYINVLPFEIQNQLIESYNLLKSLDKEYEKWIDKIIENSDKIKSDSEYYNRISARMMSYIKYTKSTIFSCMINLIKCGGEYSDNEDIRNIYEWMVKQVKDMRCIIVEYDSSNLTDEEYKNFNKILCYENNRADPKKKIITLKEIDCLFNNNI